MTAAEVNFPNPPVGQPGWLELAQAVFNTQADPLRHDTECGGGLHWQIPPFNLGYNYKNTIANGCFFAMGARLARYTGNDTYAQVAENTWNWMTNVGLINTTGDDWMIYDGAHTDWNCTDLNGVQYSYNVAVLLLGTATMYNYVSLPIHCP